MTAKELARGLNCKVTEINSKLYGPLTGAGLVEKHDNNWVLS